MLHCVQVVWEEKAMTALRLVLLLLLFVCYCRAREDCFSCSDPRVSVPCNALTWKYIFWTCTYASGFAFRTQKFKILPSNVERLADYISPNVDIKETVMHFKPKEDRELLLKVPIETPDSTLVVMLGTNSSYLNEWTYFPTFMYPPVCGVSQ